MSETTIPPEFYANHRDQIIRVLCAMRLDGPDEPRVLVDHAAAIVFEVVSRGENAAPDSHSSSTLVGDADLPVRAYNILRTMGVKDLKEFENPARLCQLWRQRGCGMTTFNEVKLVASRLGVKVPSVRYGE